LPKRESESLTNQLLYQQIKFTMQTQNIPLNIAIQQWIDANNGIAYTFNSIRRRTIYQAKKLNDTDFLYKATMRVKNALQYLNHSNKN